ncbi:unnamed protein product [Ectocarpus sp. CCAP 1310/34]|nr:unnamed protein product [Ectocarpus sp. CCAP 1310/34]
MTKPKGRNKPTGGVGGRETKAGERPKTAAARDALALDRCSAKLEQERAALASEMAQREQALRARVQALRAKEVAFAKKEEAAPRAAAQREKREQEEVERVEAAAACSAEKVAQDLDYMDTSVHEVKPKKGEVARTFKIGHDKVRRINNHWWDHRQLYETTAVGRGKTAKKDDGRRRLTKVQEDQLREFINDGHKAARQVFRRTVAEWMHRTCNMEQPSNRSAGGLLSRLGYKRRRGRIKTPPLNAERLAPIRRFLVEMDTAKRAEDAGLAVIVYMDESFVHQAHGSPYSYFPSDDDGVVQDGIGRTTGKGLRMIMVHAITKWGPLAKLCDGLPIEEGWFKETGSGKKEMEDEETAEFLWQVKLAKGDYHAAMTDSMFMEWLEHRLNPAYNAIPDFKGKRMILVLDNTKKHNVDLLRMFGVNSIRVKRKEGEQGVVEHNLEVPTEPGPSFPAGNREGGVSRAEVATATREYIHLNHPERLEERVVTFMRKKGWALIWTPPYMPSFQPIELFWQHGKQYVSLNFELKRKMREVWVQIRKGWYGDKEWPGQEGGWKAADCSKLVDHAIGEMNKWVKDRDGVLSGTIGSLEKPDGYDTDDVSPVGDVEEGVGEQIQQESAEWGDGSDEVEP